MAISKATEKNGTPLERQNITLNGVYLGNITLWDDSSSDTQAVFELLKEGHTIGGVKASNPVTGKSVEDIKAELLAKMAA